MNDDPQPDTDTENAAVDQAVLEILLQSSQPWTARAPSSDGARQPVWSSNASAYCSNYLDIRRPDVQDGRSADLARKLDHG